MEGGGQAWKAGSTEECQSQHVPMRSKNNAFDPAITVDIGHTPGTSKKDWPVDCDYKPWRSEA